MQRVLPLLGLLALAGCAGTPIAPDANPLKWTATYPKPYQQMTYCLNAQSVDYQTVLGMDAQRGIGGVELVARRDGLQLPGKAGTFEIRRLTDTTSQVTFRSAIQTLGGSSSIEDWARGAAEACAQ